MDCTYVHGNMEALLYGQSYYLTFASMVRRIMSIACVSMLNRFQAEVFFQSLLGYDVFSIPTFHRPHEQAQS